MAGQFDLPVEFVQSVLHSLEPRREKGGSTNDFSALIAVIGRARAMFRRLTHEPLTFVAITTLLSIAIYIGILVSSGRFAPSQSQDASLINIGGTLPYLLSLLSATLVLHMACYFRHGTVRIALLGSVIVWMIASMTLVILVWFRQDQTTAPLPLVMALVTFVSLVLCLFYTAVASTASVLGGVYWVNRAERAKGERTRQELISHLFDLQDRLNQPTAAAPLPELTPWQVFIARINRLPIQWSFGTGLLLALAYIGMTRAFLSGVESMSSGVGSLFNLTSICWQFMVVATMALLSFAMRSLLNALSAMSIFLLALHSTFLIPIDPFGWNGTILREMLSTPGLIQTVSVTFLAVFLGVGGARIDSKHQLNQRLISDDRAALLAEIVQTEWQLQLQVVRVCVVVIDVAKSSIMKLNAHPLEVEYSFREYQHHLRDIAALYEGEVHSTAGDGAVLAFPSSPLAFEAARRIQSSMPEFNRSRNRLKSPFRVRVGLHEGAVAGDISDVQFTEVIDIAAHVEALAPVGGIALTLPVAEHLPGARLASMNEKVAEYPLFTALNVLDDTE